LRFSTEDDAFICHEQEYNDLLMYINNSILYTSQKVHTIFPQNGKIPNKILFGYGTIMTVC